MHFPSLDVLAGKCILCCVCVTVWKKESGAWPSKRHPSAPASDAFAEFSNVFGEQFAQMVVLCVCDQCQGRFWGVCVLSVGLSICAAGCMWTWQSSHKHIRLWCSRQAGSCDSYSFLPYCCRHCIELPLSEHSAALERGRCIPGSGSLASKAL